MQFRRKSLESSKQHLLGTYIMSGTIVILGSSSMNAWTPEVVRHPSVATRTVNLSPKNERIGALTLRKASNIVFRNTQRHLSETNDEHNTATVMERPDPSVLLAAQSDTSQQLGILMIVSALGLGTVVVVNLLSFLETILPDGWYAAWRDYTWPIPFSLIFIAAGVTHFTMKETYTAMVPPKGTWGGLWQVPAPYLEQIFKDSISYEEYHVYWSGLAEIGGGLLLLASFGFHIVPMVIPAFLVFLLLICVTPANIYMATHDVQAPGLPPIPYPEGHIGRGILQCILLAMFWKLAFP
jgi:uncharacterized membrane protein